MKWKTLPSRGNTTPGPLWGHTCTAMKNGLHLYVFGGCGSDGHRTNRLHILYPVIILWREPLTSGSPPTPRNNHSCTAVGDYLFIFGGTDGIKTFSDYYILDTRTLSWNQPIVGGTKPEPREGHSAAYVDQKLIIFGGCCKFGDSLIYYDDLYILDANFTIWRHVEATTITPSKRANHTCSSWKHQIIVIGGIDSSNNFLSDAHVLNVDTLTWRKLKTTGQLLPPRACHITIGFGKYMTVLGGISGGKNLYEDVHVLDIEKLSWTKIIPSREGPCARFFMAGDILATTDDKGVFAFSGGCNKNGEPLDDMYYLFTEQIKERSPTKQLKSKSEVGFILSYEVAPVEVGDKQDTVIDQPMPISTSIPLGSQNPFSSALTLETRGFENNIQNLVSGPFRGLIPYMNPTSPSMCADIDNRKSKAMKTTDSDDRHPGPSAYVTCTDIVMQASEVQGEPKASETQFEVPVELKNPTAAGSSMPQENQPGLKVYTRRKKKTELKVYVRRKKKADDNMVASLFHFISLLLVILLTPFLSIHSY